ncbi:hypothetical protein EVAR_81218_1 [Eumeta japonica]|uniref:Uncharacterized protein n=1 Tax=Eumeta variegata TaxID=151549 RepID=A0A4C1V0Y5_EUMVA|nr:hypothetical protein EVAR_81218_1 [Eumeta japonica]
MSQTHVSDPCLRPMSQTHVSDPCLRPMSQTHVSDPCLRPMSQTHVSDPCLRPMPKKPRIVTLYQLKALAPYLGKQVKPSAADAVVASQQWSLASSILCTEPGGGP